MTAGLAARPLLSAGLLAKMIGEAGVPCVTLVADEAAVAAAGEGLRVVDDGRVPVRVFYAIPPDDAAASRRRDEHLLWLADWIERMRWPRWSVHWPGGQGDRGWVAVHGEPQPAIYHSDSSFGGADIIRRTGRPVGEHLGRWVVLHANVITLLSCARAERDEDDAWASVASLSAACGRPGDRYEAWPITAYGACVTCYCPMFEAGGQWWHHTGGWPAGCPGPREGRDLPAEPGQWEFTRTSMTCGWCGEDFSWPETLRSWCELTGVWQLGVQLQPTTTRGLDGFAVEHHPGELVVLAETRGIARPGRDVLAHHCTKIPDEVRAEYAADIEPSRIMAALRGAPIETGEG